MHEENTIHSKVVVEPTYVLKKNANRQIGSCFFKDRDENSKKYLKRPPRLS